MLVVVEIPVEPRDMEAGPPVDREGCIVVAGDCELCDLSMSEDTDDEFCGTVLSFWLSFCVTSEQRVNVKSLSSGQTLVCTSSG